MPAVQEKENGKLVWDSTDRNIPYLVRTRVRAVGRGRSRMVRMPGGAAQTEGMALMALISKQEKNNAFFDY